MQNGIGERERERERDTERGRERERKRERERRRRRREAQSDGNPRSHKIMVKKIGYSPRGAAVRHEGRGTLLMEIRDPEPQSGGEGACWVNEG